MAQKQQISNGVNQQAYHKLVSGQSNGLTAVLLRFFLRVISWFYSTVIVLRNLLYSKGWLKTHRVNATVISIGNITTGGTGKTPLVIWLCNQIAQSSKLKTQNYSCAILTRGYKLRESKLSGEPAILTASCPEAKVIVEPNRVAGATAAVDKFGAQVLIMDDGFQHHRLARDLDIVAIDAMRPFGYGKVLPAGLLREPVAALKRADAVVITRCDQISESELTALEEKLRSANPNMLIAKSIHRPICAKSLGRKEIHLEELRNKNIFAFCGIGNPDAFLNTIKDLGLNLVGSKFYNDHHHYTDDCLADIYEEARYLSADLILTTQKDWTKTALPARTKDIFFAYLVIELKLLASEDKLRGLIQDTLADKILQK